ncbi:glycosyltransferase family 4 protein [Lysobacter sp. SG-8]|uniref:Glycosyltransferase family 4 protein n=1 Tax=Marilutibacter penaei TaxID=2759900 RepID=A0A7W3U2Y8_9GAMM|nr:glycosyltransferase family 4 protein [Lysobacter penaei]MBB1087958.1 glycosyltransferase family 4 protein [Lysobacter penaei]
MAESMFKERILVVAHAHPDFSLGGGEIAAYNLFRAYRECSQVEQAWFLGRADRGRKNSGSLGMRRQDEYIWEQGIGDWHLMKAANREAVLTSFAELVRSLKPTIVHAHHYMHLGLEFIRVIKNIDPTIRIYLTLHEYMAICRNNGQMIKTDGKRLCSSASPDECRACFPQHTPEDFWLREHAFKRTFDLVDGFVSPSHFLKQRYVDWGIDPERIAVIENGQEALSQVAPRVPEEGEGRNRFGFFGQITPYKGLHVLLEALACLKRKQRRRIVLEVHGANLELQTDEYRKRIETLRQPLLDEGVVQWIGPYQPHEMRHRMAGVDWVVVPSIWWENSPMVIQESFLCGRPLLVSDIGGMAEKVRHGVDGLHVATGNSVQWGRSMLAASEPTGLWERARAAIRQPLAHDACAQAHLAWFAARASSGTTRWHR